MKIVIVLACMLVGCGASSNAGLVSEETAKQDRADLNQKDAQCEELWDDYQDMIKWCNLPGNNPTKKAYTCAFVDEYFEKCVKNK